MSLCRLLLKILKVLKIFFNLLKGENICLRGNLFNSEWKTKSFLRFGIHKSGNLQLTYMAKANFVSPLGLGRKKGFLTFGQR